jgi:hypothetical protein
MYYAARHQTQGSLVSVWVGWRTGEDVKCIEWERCRWSGAAEERVRGVE